MTFVKRNTGNFGIRHVLSLVIRCVLVALLVVLVAWGIYKRALAVRKFDYNEVLDERVFTLDEEDYTFRDLAFFIAYEERIVEEEAKIYSRKNTKDYWNIHTNGQFVSVAAKEAVLDMAIHDSLMYNLALDAGTTLDENELDELSGSTADFWMDLLDGQKERLLSYTTEETVNELLRRKAVAEVYQNSLAITNNHAYVYYEPGGDGYEEILASHELDINDAEWKRFVMGDITIRHTKVNYATGYDHD